MSAMVRRPRVCLELKISCYLFERRMVGVNIVKNDAQEKSENIES
ncbi:hypothetical protein [uncultured Sphaerotilus sp.]